MNGWRLAWRGAVHYARSHAGTLLGAAAAATVLVGALVVGDSVRGTLRQLARERIGNIEVAASTGERLFMADLDRRVTALLSVPGAAGPGQIPVVSALSLPAVAVAPDAQARANRVRILGVNPAFWRLWPEKTTAPPLPPEGVVLNEALARQLGVGLGQEVLFRIAKPAALSRDAPLTPTEDALLAWRLKVSAVIGPEQFGNFSLQAGQTAPFNAFVSLEELQRRLEVPGRANLLLVAGPPEVTNAVYAAAVVGGALSYADRVRMTLRRVFRLADAQFEWRVIPEAGALELRTPRVFLDEVVGRTVLGSAQAAGTNVAAAQFRRVLAGLRPAGVLTYFVNEIRFGDRATPYSMVTAAEPPITPVDLREDEILITGWLAEDLAVQPGQELQLRYYVLGPDRRLVETQAVFRVRAVLPMTAPPLDRQLMPDFPGMTDAANCRDWDTGLPIQVAAIRDKDEDYWDRYRGTPKALISLAAGRKLWANRYGDLTAIRFYAQGFPGRPMSSTAQAFLLSRRAVLDGALSRLLDPADLGLDPEPVGERLRAASQGSQDFGGLFLGFSFFLVVSALLLMAVLFQFALEQRRSEVGVLLALGFRVGRVRRLFVGEGGVIALGGAVLGGVLGLGFARVMIHGLSSIWREAVGGIPLGFHPQALTVVGGVAGAWLVATGTLWIALRRLARRPARELLQAAGSTGEEAEEVAGQERHRGWLVVAVLSGLGAVAALVSAWRAEQMAAAGGFFGGGALLLICGLALAQGWLQRLAGSSSQRLDWAGLAWRGLTRRRRRSLATMALLAAGSFLIVSVGVFRLPDPRETDRRDTGTGGFALVAESTQPVLYDLSSVEGRDAYGLPEDLWQGGGGVVAFRMREGEEASCLNLNRAQRPRVLGVDPEALASRGAFRFARMAKGLPRALGWRALDREACREAGLELGPEEVPAIGDAASIQYALGSRVGGVIPYRDERGREFKLRLVGAVANSILQGNLVIAETEFVRRFPGEAGYRWFLIEAPAGRRQTIARTLSRALADLGFEVTDARVRLAAFNAVQNTYLGTFQVLGALGLLLGSFGLGAVVLRNVLERRAEVALMLAVGFPTGRLQSLLLREHGWLLAGGLGIGVISALLAVLPSVWKLGIPAPLGSLALTLAAVAVNGLVWTWLATRAAMRGNLIEALRND